MNTIEHIYFEDATKFRNWLKKYHNKSAGIWMIYYKKHTNKKCIDYSDALDEAICYGWIDSIVKRIDNDIYVRKFTPRKNINNWSEVNKRKLKKLIDNNSITNIGLSKVSSDVTNEILHSDLDKKNKPKRNLVIPEYFKAALANNKDAICNFNNLTTTQKLNYINWVDSAKKLTTKNRRLNIAIEKLTRGELLGLK